MSTSLADEKEMIDRIEHLEKQVAELEYSVHIQKTISHQIKTVVKELMSEHIKPRKYAELIYEKKYDLARVYYQLFYEGTEEENEFIKSVFKIVIRRNSETAFHWIIDQWKDYIIESNSIPSYLYLICSKSIKYLEYFYEVIPVTLDHYYCGIEKPNAWHGGISIIYIFDLFFDKDKFDYLIWIMEKHNISKDELVKLFSCNSEMDCDPQVIFIRNFITEPEKFKKLYQILPFTMDMYKRPTDRSLSSVLDKAHGWTSGVIDSLEFIVHYHDLSPSEFKNMIKDNLGCKPYIFIGDDDKELRNNAYDRLEILLGCKGVVSGEYYRIYHLE